MELIVRCPYCSEEVDTDLDQQVWKDEIGEFLAVPLAARIGNISDHEQKWQNVGYESELGGFLTLWNRSVGILRLFDSGIKVTYKEFVCTSPRCGYSPFDLFVNLTPDRYLSDFWPHLTGELDKDQKYSEWDAKMKFERLFDQPRWGYGVLILLTFIYLLAGVWNDQYLRTLGIFEFVVLRCLAVILVAWMLYSVKNLSSTIKKSYWDFRELIVISNENALHFWHNFILARVSGVRTKPKKIHKFSQKTLSEPYPRFSISQATIVGGIPSFLIVVIIWIFNFSDQIGSISFIGLTDLFFWGLIAYFTGISAWVGLNVGVFVLMNISFLPMKLSALTNFANISPIRKLASISLSIVIPVLLLPLTLVIFFTFSPTPSPLLGLWLLPWIRITLGLAFIIIGLADTGILILGLVYIVLLSVFVFLPDHSTIAQYSISIDWINTITLGLFLSILLFYHLLRAFGPIRNLMEKSKQDTINLLNRQLLIFSEELQRAENYNGQFSTEDISRRDSILQNMERVITIREKVSSVKVGILTLPTMFGILSPLFSSVIIPLLLDIFKDFTVNRLNP